MSPDALQKCEVGENNAFIRIVIVFDKTPPSPSTITTASASSALISGLAKHSGAARDCIKSGMTNNFKPHTYGSFRE